MILTAVDTNGHPVMGRTANTHHAPVCLTWKPGSVV